MKKNKSSLSSLQKELDRVFSLWRRQVEAKDGIVKCCTCEKIGHWRTFHCGHFWSRRHFSLRWCTENTFPQCPKCNLFNQGSAPAFSLFLVRKYGQEILEKLEIKKNNQMKMDKFIYEQLINETKQKIINIGGELK